MQNVTLIFYQIELYVVKITPRDPDGNIIPYLVFDSVKFTEAADEGDYLFHATNILFQHSSMVLSGNFHVSSGDFGATHYPLGHISLDHVIWENCTDFGYIQLRNAAKISITNSVFLNCNAQQGPVSISVNVPKVEIVLRNTTFLNNSWPSIYNGGKISDISAAVTFSYNKGGPFPVLVEDTKFICNKVRDLGTWGPGIELFLKTGDIQLTTKNNSVDPHCMVTCLDLGSFPYMDIFECQPCPSGTFGTKNSCSNCPSFSQSLVPKNSDSGNTFCTCLIPLLHLTVDSTSSKFCVGALVRIICSLVIIVVIVVASLYCCCCRKKEVEYEPVNIQ